MRIVIDIDGEEVRVHRVIGDALPPAEVIVRAAALSAESAGVAMLPGGVMALDAVGAEPTDAGRAPSASRRAPAAATSVARSRTTHTRPASASTKPRRKR